MRLPFRLEPSRDSKKRINTTTSASEISSTANQ